MKRKLQPAEDWLKSPIKSSIGTIWMAGFLNNDIQIPRNNMRILGRYALMLVLEGNAFYEDASGGNFILKPGNAVLVTPDLPHAYGSQDGKAWSQVYVVFDGPQFDLLQASPSFHGRQPVWYLDSIHLWKERIESVLRLSGEIRKPEIQTLGQFTQLLIELVTTDGPQDLEKDKRVQESLFLLGEQQGDGWMSPQEVATKVGLSYENFRKLFTQSTGSPPTRFQRQRKIDWACTAIYRGAGNFKELAEALDFCDVYHFSKAFRQVKGMPPSAYRKSVQGK